MYTLLYRADYIDGKLSNCHEITSAFSCSRTLSSLVEPDKSKDWRLRLRKLFLDRSFTGSGEGNVHDLAGKRKR